MTNLNDIQSLKQSNASKLDAAITAHVQSLKETTEWVDLVAKCSEFENDAYNKTNEFIFDSDGMLNARIQLDIVDSWHDGDNDILEAISEALHDQFECLYFTVSRGDSIIKVEQCLGESVIIRDTASRGEYYIHSSELSLKLTKDKVQNEEHGLYLIECAMRKAGIFGGIVETDYYGDFIRFSDTGLGAKTDEELDAYGKQFDESEES